MPTYEITGEWTGPQSPAGDWTRVPHIERVRARSKKAEDWVQAVSELGAIRFTDGTALVIRVRDVTGERGRPAEKKSYGKLIRDCVRHGVRAVADLPRRD